MRLMKLLTVSILLSVGMVVAGYSDQMPTAAASRDVMSVLRASVIQDDVQLSLTIGRRSYPRNALVPVSVRVTNLSKSPVTLELVNCTGYVGQAEVRGLRGPPVYPSDSLLPTVTKGVCPGPGAVSPQPGESFASREYVILRGPYVEARAAVDVQQGDPVHPTEIPLTLVTPKLRMHLYRSPAPAVTIRRSPPVEVILHPLAGQMHGHLRYIDWYRCSGSPSQIGGTHTLWPALSSGGVLRPGCAAPEEWHLIAAWVGQPFVRFNYTRP